MSIYIVFFIYRLVGWCGCDDVWGSFLLKLCLMDYFYGLIVFIFIIVL